MTTNTNTINTTLTIRNLLDDTIGKGMYQTTTLPDRTALFSVDGKPVPMESVEAAEEFILNHEVDQFMMTDEFDNDYYMTG